MSPVDVLTTLLSMQRPTVTPGRDARRRSSRDRHDRGLRGPLVPAEHPAARSRGERFDALVAETFGRLTEALPELDGVQVAVDDLPPDPAVVGLDPADPVPLGRVIAAADGLPDRIVVHRRPVELRAEESGQLKPLLADVLTALVATLLGLDPEDVDPDFGL